MNWQTIRTLIAKDFKLFFRNRFFGIMTIFGIVLYIVFYFIMPNVVEETIETGSYAPPVLNIFKEGIEEEGLTI